MLILILIDVQYSQKVVFSFEREEGEGGCPPCNAIWKTLHQTIQTFFNGKQYYTVFQSLCQVILTVSESSFQIKL